MCLMFWGQNSAPCEVLSSWKLSWLVAGRLYLCEGIKNEKGIWVVLCNWIPVALQEDDPKDIGAFIMYSLSFAVWCCLLLLESFSKIFFTFDLGSPELGVKINPPLFFLINPASSVLLQHELAYCVKLFSTPFSHGHHLYKSLGYPLVSLLQGCA